MFFIKLISWAPLWVLYAFSDLLAFIGYHIIKYRREVIFDNLSRSFPEKNQKEIRIIAKGFYHNLSDIVVEAIKGTKISKQKLLKRVEFIKGEIIEDYVSAGKSVLLITIHQCNWEWMLLAGCAKFNFPIDAVYQTLSNKKHDQFMLKARSRFGGNPIPFETTVVEIIKRKNTPGAFAMVADQVPAKDAEKYWINFLNQETPFLMGPQHLPKLIKSPVVFMGMKRVKRGYYQVTLEKVAEPPYEKESYEIMEKFVEKAEKLIHDAPSDWLWSHRRWKYKKPLYG